MQPRSCHGHVLTASPCLLATLPDSATPPTQLRTHPPTPHPQRRRRHHNRRRNRRAPRRVDGRLLRRRQRGGRRRRRLRRRLRGARPRIQSGAGAGGRGAAGRRDDAAAAVVRALMAGSDTRGLLRWNGAVCAISYVTGIQRVCGVMQNPFGGPAGRRGVRITHPHDARKTKKGKRQT